MSVKNIYLVSKDSPSDFKSLSEAVIKAEEGATIFIEGGVYEEVFNIDKNLTLVGALNEEVIVRVPRSSYCGVHKGVAIENITFESGDYDADWEEYMRDQCYPLLLVESNAYIQNCKFLNATEGVGLRIENNVTTEISNCLFDNNKINFRVSDFSFFNMTNCIIKNAKKYGIFMSDNAVGTFIHSKIFNNKKDNAILKDHVTAFFKYCENYGSEGYAARIAKRVSVGSLSSLWHDNKKGMYGSLE